MKHAIKMTGLGLLSGAAVTLALAGPAAARGPLSGGFGADDGLAMGGRNALFVQVFADLDKDGNGLITEEDLVTGATERLATVDTDGNGTLSVDELAAQVLTRINERMDGRKPGPRMADPETMAKTIAERMIEARDADKDGVLSLAELSPSNGFGRVIDRFDTDDDNAISEAEFDAAKAEIQARMAQRDEMRGGKQGGHDGKRN